MRILIYGAGPLGSLLSVRLQQGGHDVTLIARGKRLSDLQKHGVCLKSWTTHKEESITVRLIEKLGPSDFFDIILVVMRKNNALEILPILAANSSRIFVFLMNNAAGPDAFTDALGKDRVLTGFPGAAGYREGTKVVYMNGEPDRPMNVLIGEPGGGITERLQMISAEIEKGLYLQVTMEPNMDAWSKYHIALLFPSLAPAFYLCNNDRLRAARTRDVIVLAYRAMKEGFAVLRKLGYPITPKYLTRFLWLPEPLMILFLRRLLRNPKMEVAMEKHAKAAQDEILHLIDEFMALVEKSGVFTPNMQFLVSQFRSKAQALIDGSRSIRLHWDGIVIPLLALVLLILILPLVF